MILTRLFRLFVADALQYLLPVSIPVVIAILITPLLAPTSHLATLDSLPIHNTSSFGLDSTYASIDLNSAVTSTTGLSSVVGLTEMEEENVDVSETPTPSDQAAEEALNTVEATEAAALSVAVEGGRWDEELHSAMGPTCRTDLTTVPHQGTVSTGFVSFPRSGNSYVRSLLERATGYQTSSIYCDRGLERTFTGECNHKLEFFVKVGP